MRIRALLFAAVVGLSAAQASAETLRVAAAGSLRHVLPDLIAAFGALHPDITIEAVYGASGQLARQIERGAPYDLFLSANEAFVDRLVEAGLTTDKGAVYAEGVVVLFRPVGSKAPEGVEVDQLAELVADGRLRRLAIAQPEVAPYGRAAQAVLEAAEVWDAVQRYLVFGESVAQAAQFAASGAADLAIIALSLAQVMEDVGSWSMLTIPDDARIRQKLAVVSDRSGHARGLAAFLLAEEAAATFAEHGFAPVGDH